MNFEFQHAKIVKGNVRDPQVVALLEQHLQSMKQQSPIESVHALDLDELEKSEVTFISLWSGNTLAGIGAIKQLTENHAEIKSMKTADKFKKRGVATQILNQLISIARRKKIRKISLETGTAEGFQAAHNFYRKMGFIECEPFSNYQYDPNSLYMTTTLE